MLTCLCCSGCYKRGYEANEADRKIALENGLPYWEDVIACFPRKIGYLKIDRMIVPSYFAEMEREAVVFHDINGE